MEELLLPNWWRPSFPFFLCLCTLISFPLVATSASSSNYTISDRIALLSFKSLISNDPYGALETWNSSGDLWTAWQGVTCGHRHRRVVSLDLSALNLTGIISPSITNLTFLRCLNLSDNNLRGSIPGELGSLSRLQHLNLSWNSLQGSIPTSLSHCSRIHTINLWNNLLSARTPDSSGWDFLTALSNCSELQELNLATNQLEGALPSSVGNLSATHLSLLAMSRNHISGNIPWEMSKLVSLTSLYLSDNLLTGPIPDAIGHLQQLQFLSIGSNQISGDIPPSLGNLSALSTLILSNNTLTGSIPSTLWHLSSLSVLFLRDNHLTGGIPPSLDNFSASLAMLNLADNSLTGVIPPTIGNLRALTHLYPDTNNLTGTVSRSLWNLSKLVELDLKSNHLLTGTLPSDLGHTLPDLSFLSLSDNQLHGSIPASLSSASSLEIIQLGGNLFSGTIPPSLGKLPSLTRLQLIGNQLEANMMDTSWDFLANLSNCTSLIYLNLGSNRLEGELPQSVANLSRTLEWLSMESNNISGSIPPGIGNLVSLSTLYLDHNLLTGTIPSTVRKLRKLHKLTLQNNGLSGEIPFAVGNLTQLNELRLNNNYLTGRIPITLGDCGQLRSLYIGNNNLTDVIPSRVVSISSLSNLVLGGNSLSGLLPTDVGSLINLVELDLSNNRLSGEIPRTISACQELQYLRLQGNNFSGTIPSSFSAGLEVLDLSRNNMSGHIPENLTSIRTLIMLNLSFNDLDGEVPKGAFQNSTEVLLFGNKDLCGGNPELELPPCSKQRKHRSSSLTIILSAIGASLFLVAIVFCIIFAYWQKHKSRNKQDPSVVQQLLENEYIRVSYTELLKATDGFSSANLIGQGSFGSVYKGTMSYHDNQNANGAVKVLNLQQRGASKSFMAECMALRNIRHRNLLKILTSCSSIDLQGNDFKALVFEYLPNGSLEKWLHCTENDERVQKKLSLVQRLNIAVDIALALDYLHNKGHIPIVHCDLKPSNVLLDNDMTAHVGDFGLARFLTEYATSSSHRSTSSVILKGSIGYIAPEYGIGNEVSTRGDLYSYGIIILEMFTGRGPTDDGFKEGLNLHRFVGMAFPEQLMRIIDPYLLVGGDDDILPQGMGVRNKTLECIAEVLQIGLSCSNESPTDRMNIEDVIKKMQDIRDVYNRNGTQG